MIDTSHRTQLNTLLSSWQWRGKRLGS
uniref:Uncharacterized protein n=1 Tax=Amphimedon queenslandica TaxID=400682 RepID=I1FNY8_AMPQE